MLQLSNHQTKLLLSSVRHSINDITTKLKKFPQESNCEWTQEAIASMEAKLVHYKALEQELLKD